MTPVFGSGEKGRREGEEGREKERERDRESGPSSCRLGRRRLRRRHFDRARAIKKETPFFLSFHLSRFSLSMSASQRHRDACRGGERGRDWQAEASFFRVEKKVFGSTATATATKFRRRRETQSSSFLSRLTARRAGRDARPGRGRDARARQARRRGEGRLHSGASGARAGGEGETFHSFFRWSRERSERRGGASEFFSPLRSLLRRRHAPALRVRSARKAESCESTLKDFYSRALQLQARFSLELSLSLSQPRGLANFSLI